MLRHHQALLAIVLLISPACRREVPPPPPAAPATALERTPSPPPAPVPASPTAGGEFNRFFPPAKAGSLERVFTQEKPGFALAEILRDGKKVALLSIVDLAAAGEGVPAKPSRTLAGFPVHDTGSMQTSAVIASRYKVVARSTDPSFTAQDRDRLVQSVDLAGLAALAGDAK